MDILLNEKPTSHMKTMLSLLLNQSGLRNPQILRS